MLNYENDNVASMSGHLFNPSDFLPVFLFLRRLQPELDQAPHGLGTRGLILLFGHPYVECRKRRGLHSDDYLHALACGRRSAFFLC